MTLFLSVSLSRPVSAATKPTQMICKLPSQMSLEESKQRRFLVKIVNNSNRYINLYPGSSQNFHVTIFQLPPAEVRWSILALFSPVQTYILIFAKQHIGGAILSSTKVEMRIWVATPEESPPSIRRRSYDFKPGSKLRIDCPERRSLEQEQKRKYLLREIETGGTLVSNHKNGWLTAHFVFIRIGSFVRE